MSRSKTSIAKDRIRTRQWFADHSDYARNWRENNKDKTRQYSLKGRVKHAKKIKAYAKLIWDRDKEKEKARWRGRRYGLSQQQYLDLRTRQCEKCPICECPLGPSPCIDHCHDTKAIRGLLCRQCNMALGLFGDGASRLQRAIDYLKGGFK